MTAGKKKSFTGKINHTNPAVSFLSDPEEKEIETPEEPIVSESPASRVSAAKPAPVQTPKTEKDKKLTIMMKSGVFEDLKMIATMKRISLTSLMNSVLNDFCANETAIIKRYKDTFLD
jgi:hypothetical protein